MIWVLYVLVLVLVSSLVAFLGDILGRNIGKRRIKLFGLRPRNTAILVTSLTGGVITLFTIGVLVATNDQLRNVPNLVAQSNELLRELNMRKMELDLAKSEYERDLSEYEEKQNKLETQLSELESQRLDAENRLEQTELALATSTTEKEELEQEAGRLRSEITTIDRQLTRQKREISANQALIAGQEREYQKLFAETRALETQVRTYQEGEIVVTEGARVAEEYLRPEFKSRSAENIAGGIKSSLQPPSDIPVTFTLPSDAEYLAAAQRIKDMEGQPAIMLRATVNGVKGGTVPLELDVQPVKVIFKVGEEIYRRPFTTAVRPQDTNSIYNDMFSEIRKEAIKRGMVPMIDGSVGGFNSLSLHGFTNSLLEIRAGDTLVLTAIRDIGQLDPLEAEVNFTWEVERE